MAITKIEEPDALADVVWVPADQGGRVSGPPTAPVYQATAVFELGGERETEPEWPRNATHVSIRMQRIAPVAEGFDRYKLGFPAAEIARPLLSVGVTILIMEGPKIVAEATVREVLPHSDGGNGWSAVE